MRRFFQSLFCFCISPLLMAEQAVQPTSPRGSTNSASAPHVATLSKGTYVKLILLENVTSATAKKHQKVQMAVAENVIVEGTIVISAGTPATGEVSAVRKAVLGKKNGEIEVRAIAVNIDGKILKLGEYAPGEDACGDFGPCWAMGLIFAPFVPIALARHAVQAHRVKESGSEAYRPACSPDYGYTRETVLLPISEPNHLEPSFPELVGSADCPLVPRRHTRP